MYIKGANRYRINPNGGRFGHAVPLLIKELSPKDGLSPLWFLELSNSLDAFEGSTVALNYGETVLSRLELYVRLEIGF